MRKSWLALCAVLLALSAVLIALCRIVDVPDHALAASLEQVSSITEVALSSAPNDLDTTIFITGTGFAAVRTGDEEPRRSFLKTEYALALQRQATESQ